MTSCEHLPPDGLQPPSAALLPPKTCLTRPSEIASTLPIPSRPLEGADDTADRWTGMINASSLVIDSARRKVPGPR
jgi:hypothetical protein